MRAAWFGQRGARVENRKSALYHRSHAPVSTVQEHVRAVINSVSMQITTTLPDFGSTGNPAAGPARRPRPAGRCWDRQLGMSGGRCGRPIGSRTLGLLDRSVWPGASACGLRVAGGSTRDAVTVPMGARSRSECRRAFARQRQTVCRTSGLWSRRCWHTCWCDRFWIFDT